MANSPKMMLSRRGFLAGCSGAALACSPLKAFAAPSRRIDLRPAPGRVQLLPDKYPDTAVLAYNGTNPGPLIRLPQGGRLRVAVDNALDDETTVHWHGLRIPNAMDGVPDLTQQPIAPGGGFTYEFDVPDAGTYWYHPHQRGPEQVARGLYGALIVDEAEPVAVDRDILWILDDWRLTEEGRISEDFSNMMDITHAGRIGNTVTVNGRVPETFDVRAGERIRLRLINSANARIFGLDFEGHAPKVIALDGQPVEPHEPAGGRIVLAPAMRADLILDMTGKPGERFKVADRYYARGPYRLLDLVYGDEPLRSEPPDTPIALPANPIPEPDLGNAVRHEILFSGGMMGRMESAMMQGRQVPIREMVRRGAAWAINGVAATGHVMDPLLTLKRDHTYVFAMTNDTAWPHPIHLHGHSFRVLSRDGRKTRYREWQDTVLMSPNEKVEIAFVADNPGDWMFHCHILEHQAAGMMGVIQVA